MCRVLSDERLKAIAAYYEKSVAQLCIRFAMQNDIIPLPKSLNPERMADNAKVFDFQISDEHMNEIASMEEFGYSGFHPDNAWW